MNRVDILKPGSGKTKSKVKKPKLTESEKREKIRDALLKKKSYEDHALKLVEQLLEVDLSPTWLINSATFLNKDYYSDGVEERAMTGVCGYPLCDKKREEKRRRGQFHISLKDKKVYDLEERKLFCSSWCFKASNFFREQLETSPLWLREVEKPKEVSLYQGERTVVEGGGKVVDIAIVKPVIVESAEPHDSEVDDCEPDESEEEEASVTEKLILDNDKMIGNNVDLITESINKFVIDDKREALDLINDTFDNIKISERVTKTKVKIKAIQDVTEAVPAQISNSMNSSRPRYTKTRPNHTVAREPAVIVVSSAINSWFTIDSFRVVMGDQELKVRLEENKVEGDVWATTVGDKDMAEQYQARYRDICRKLDMWERLDNKEDVVEKLPLPSFEMVREHCEVENLKLSSYMAGSEMYEQEVVAKGNIVEQDSGHVEPRLPLLDHKSQQLLRRRIVLDKLFRTLPELLKLFYCSLEEVRGDLRLLVSSFKFSADNVVFQTEEWTLMGLVLLKLLALKNSKLKSALAEKDSLKFIKLILLSHQLEVAALDLIVTDLTGDVMKLIQKYNIEY